MRLFGSRNFGRSFQFYHFNYFISRLRRSRFADGYRICQYPAAQRSDYAFFGLLGPCWQFQFGVGRRGWRDWLFGWLIIFLLAWPDRGAPAD